MANKSFIALAASRCLCDEAWRSRCFDCSKLSEDFLDFSLQKYFLQKLLLSFILFLHN